MSRIGKQPIAVPKGVTVKLDDSTFSAKGPKGELSIGRHKMVDIEEKNGVVTLEPKEQSKQARAAHGLMRALCSNVVTGVSQGFTRQLEINGVGYRAEVKGKDLVLQLGYSHPIEYPLPEGITAKVEKNIVTLSGIDKQLLGSAAAKIRGFRPPEPYKGKGVKYIEEQIQRKEGKAAG